MDGEAIKRLGHLGFFLTCVKEGQTTKHVCQGVKKDPKEGGPWEAEGSPREGHDLANIGHSEN